MWFSKSVEMISPEEALPGRADSVLSSGTHAALGVSLLGPFPDGSEIAYVAMGCFWGAERAFYSLQGVEVTAVGYQGGYTPNATYEEVCSGRTGHTEAVMVVCDPKKLSYEQVLAHFYEQHDPTQGFRQGNDVGTQYRSAIYTTSPAQATTARAVTERFGAVLAERGLGPITTEVAEAGPFYYAEEYHQQYLVKVPNGYCGLGGTGVSCPVGVL